jgi:hypothetical protein
MEIETSERGQSRTVVDRVRLLAYAVGHYRFYRPVSQ